MPRSSRALRLASIALASSFIAAAPWLPLAAGEVDHDPESVLVLATDDWQALRRDFAATSWGRWLADPETVSIARGLTTAAANCFVAGGPPERSGPRREFAKFLEVYAAAHIQSARGPGTLALFPVGLGERQSLAFVAHFQAPQELSSLHAELARRLGALDPDSPSTENFEVGSVPFAGVDGFWFGRTGDECFAGSDRGGLRRYVESLRAGSARTGRFGDLPHYASARLAHGAARHRAYLRLSPFWNRVERFLRARFGAPANQADWLSQLGIADLALLSGSFAVEEGGTRTRLHCAISGRRGILDLLNPARAPLELPRFVPAPADLAAVFALDLDRLPEKLPFRVERFLGLDAQVLASSLEGTVALMRPAAPPGALELFDPDRLPLFALCLKDSAHVEGLLVEMARIEGSAERVRRGACGAIPVYFLSIPDAPFLIASGFEERFAKATAAGEGDLFAAESGCMLAVAGGWLFVSLSGATLEAILDRTRAECTQPRLADSPDFAPLRARLAGGGIGVCSTDRGALFAEAAGLLDALSPFLPLLFAEITERPGLAGIFDPSHFPTPQTLRRHFGAKVAVTRIADGGVLVEEWERSASRPAPPPKD